MTPYISFSLNFAITTFLIFWLPTTESAAAGLIGDYLLVLYHCAFQLLSNNFLDKLFNFSINWLDDPEEPLMYVELDQHYRIYQKKDF